MIAPASLAHRSACVARLQQSPDTALYYSGRGKRDTHCNYCIIVLFYHPLVLFMERSGITFLSYRFVEFFFFTADTSRRILTNFRELFPVVGLNNVEKFRYATFRKVYPKFMGSKKRQKLTIFTDTAFAIDAYISNGL